MSTNVVDIHAAVVSYLQNAGLPYVNNPETAIVQYVEKQMSDGTLFFPQDTPGLTTGVCIFTWMLSGQEERTSPGPWTPGQTPQGAKWVPYKIGLNCFLRCTDPQVSVAALANEEFIDALITAIRFYRNANAPGLIFQWGEGDTAKAGGVDIKWTQDAPVTLEGSGVAGQTQINTRFEVSVCQVLNT